MDVIYLDARIGGLRGTCRVVGLWYENCGWRMAHRVMALCANVSSRYSALSKLQVLSSHTFTASVNLSVSWSERVCLDLKS
jgi:hypothetical protein